MEITDTAVEQALEAWHRAQMDRDGITDKPYWYSGLEHWEREYAHDAMRAALEAVVDDIARVAWDESKEAHEKYEEEGYHAWGHVPEEPVNPYISKYDWDAMEKRRPGGKS